MTESDICVDNTCDDEPSMFVQRPSSSRSQDITHILVRTFRELFTKDVIAPDVIENLTTSRCSDDECHQEYVNNLMKVCIVVHSAFPVNENSIIISFYFLMLCK